MIRSKKWVYVVLSLLVIPEVSAKVIDAESEIRAVTVFPDRSTIVRYAAVQLPVGASSVRIGPLPSTLEPASVSANGVGESEIVLYGVNITTTQLEKAQDPKVKDIEEEIRKLLRHQRRLHNLKKVLAKEREYLDSIQAASSEQIGKDLITRSPDADDAATLLEFLDHSLLDNFDRDQEAEIKLEELAFILDKLQRELARLSRSRQKQQKWVLVDLSTEEAGTFTLEISYRVPGVSWQPTYEARAYPIKGEVTLVSYGVVRQQTGEDWTNVELTLSTAKPALAGSLPELQPWFLRPLQPRRKEKAMRQSAVLAMAPMMDAVLEQPEEEAFGLLRGRQDVQAKLAYATATLSGPSVTFRLPKPVSLASDWQPQKFPVHSQLLSAEFAYEATPRLMAHAFLRAKVTNATNNVYLPGQVAVFLEGAFVANALLKQVEPGEEFDLYLGVDERIKIHRRKIQSLVEVSLLPGLRGKMRSTDYEYLTVVENFASSRVDIIIYDQYPVSEQEEITVESIRFSPEEIEKDSEKPGIFHWSVELLPGQKEELTLAYRVRHPVEMLIQ